MEFNAASGQRRPPHLPFAAFHARRLALLPFDARRDVQYGRDADHETGGSRYWLAIGVRSGEFTSPRGGVKPPLQNPLPQRRGREQTAGAIAPALQGACGARANPLSRRRIADSKIDAAACPLPAAFCPLPLPTSAAAIGPGF